MSASLPLVGFTGPRGLSQRFSSLVGAVVQSVARSGRGVAVGDASGLDRFVAARARQCGVQPRVFRPSRQYQLSWCPLQPSPATGLLGPVPEPGTGLPTVVSRPAGPHFAAALARRSAAMVSAVASSGAGAGLVGFVAAPCPLHPRSGKRLVPSPSSSQCFAGFGSGTWATLAFAVGVGLPVVVFGCGVSRAALPAYWGGIWVAAASSGPWSRGYRFVPLQRALPGVPFSQPWQQ